MELRYKIKEIPDEGLVVSQPIPADLMKDALEGLEPDLAQCGGGIELTLTRARTSNSGQPPRHGLGGAPRLAPLASPVVIVAGRVSAALLVACGACLKPATLTVRAPLNAVYVEGDEDEPTEDDDLDAEDVLHYDGEMIDLRPLIREQLILSLPMSVRCKEDCKGLCPVCGGDRNVKDCGHKVEIEETPFAALKSLKLE